MRARVMIGDDGSCMIVPVSVRMSARTLMYAHTYMY